MNPKTPAPTRVLLVDPDLDALGRRAALLRSHGVAVAIASDTFDAIEQAYQGRPDVVLAATDADPHGELVVGLRAVPELADVPVLHLVLASAEPLAADEVPEGDVEQLLTRLSRTATASQRIRSVRDLSGNLEEVPLVDLLQLLGMNKRSGALRIATPTATGEVQLGAGEIVAATYHQTSGEKAVIRLLSQPTGRFSFVPGAALGQRRIDTPTSLLLMDAMRQLDETARRRKELALEDEALVRSDGPVEALEQDLAPTTTRAGPSQPAMTEILALLGSPRTLEELLDEVPAPDLAIVDAVAELIAAGLIRRIARSSARTPLGPEGTLAELRLQVTRLRRSGFGAGARLVIAASHGALADLALAVRNLADALPPLEAAGAPRLARQVGRLRLGEGQELELVGLPCDAAMSPTWAFVVSASVAVVRVEGLGGALLEAHCRAADVPLLDAEGLVGPVDLGVPRAVADLLRAAIGSLGVS